MKLLICLGLTLVTYFAWSQEVDTAAVRQEVDSLIRISERLINQGGYDEALETIATAGDIALEKVGRESAAYSDCCFVRGKINFSIRKIREAEKWHAEALKIREKVLGKDHPGYSESLNALGLVYILMPKYDMAEALIKEALSIDEKVFGKHDSRYAQTLQNLAICYRNSDQYEKAEPLYLEVIATLEKTMGKQSSEYAYGINSLAVLYRYMGLYEKAEPLYLEAIAIRSVNPGKDHPDYAQSLSNLAVLYSQIGNNEKAEELHLEAKNIRQKVQGKEEAQSVYSQSVSNLAAFYTKLGLYEKAEEYFHEALAIRGKGTGKDHHEYAITLTSLAAMYTKQGNFAKAESMLLEAIPIKEKTQGKEHSSYGKSLGSLAKVYWKMGMLEDAAAGFQQVIAIFEKSLGEEHPDYAKELNELGGLYVHQGMKEKAAPLLLKSGLIRRANLIKSSRHLSERELSLRIKQFSQDFDRYYSFVQQHSSAAEDFMGSCYDNALFYKGFLLTAVNKVKRLAQTNPATEEQFNLLQSYHRRLEKEYAKPIDRRQGLAELEEKANMLEKELVRSIAGLGAAFRQVSWKEVQQSLKSGEAALEFVHYRYYDKQFTDSIMYAAMLLRPGDQAPVFLPLFEEKELLLGENFSAINNLYLSRSQSEGQKSLYELIWQPMEARLKGIHTIYYAPSGLLHRINLGAAALKDGVGFADRYKLARLNSTRQLVLPDFNSGLGRGAYVVGGIRYDNDDAAIAMANTGVSFSNREGLSFQPEAVTRGNELDYLPGSKAEALEISDILLAAGIPTRLDTGFYATEERFRSIGVDGPSPRILHLATHGFFFPDPKSSAEGVQRGIDAGAEVFKLSEHPMLRSGLLFAGANEAWLGAQLPEGQEDGICTAYEISQMNLANTELVVLSACQSGLGDIEGNEGVYGLQRAFKIAGTKYLIMSLWEVNDLATREFMTEFYRQWLQEGGTIPDAFRVAEAVMKAKYPDMPYFWAGFVLVE